MIYLEILWSIFALVTLYIGIKTYIEFRHLSWGDYASLLMLLITGPVLYIIVGVVMIHNLNKDRKIL